MIFNPRIQKSAGPVGTQISTLEVGTLVKMNINGAPWEWKIVHQGLPGSMYDSSCDGCWLLLENIYENRQWNSSNVNDYANSTIKAYLNGDFFELLDSGIQSQVKEVKIPYRPGSGISANVSSGANGLSCKIFPLSSREIGYDDESDSPNDGEKLDFFEQEGASLSFAKRVAKYNGIENSWALRSPYLIIMGFGDSVLSIDLDGSVTSSYLPSRLIGVRPTLILPSTALVDDDLNVLAA